MVYPEGVASCGIPTQGPRLMQPLRGRFPIFPSDPGFDEYIEPWALVWNAFSVIPANLLEIILHGVARRGESEATWIRTLPPSGAFSMAGVFPGSYDPGYWLSPLRGWKCATS